MCVRLFVSVLNLIRRLNVVVHNYYTDYVKRSRVWIDLGSAIVDNRCNNYNDDDDDNDYECVRHVRQFFIEHHDESTVVSGNKFLFPVIRIRFWKRNELRKSVSFQVRNWGRGKLFRKKVFSHFTRVCCWPISSSWEIAFICYRYKTPPPHFFLHRIISYMLRNSLYPVRTVLNIRIHITDVFIRCFSSLRSLASSSRPWGFTTNSGCCRPFINRLIVVFDF